MIVNNIKPQGDRFVFPDIRRVIVLASGRLLIWCAPLVSFLLDAGAAQFAQVLEEKQGLQDWSPPLAMTARRESGELNLHALGAALSVSRVPVCFVATLVSFTTAVRGPLRLWPVRRSIKLLLLTPVRRH